MPEQQALRRSKLMEQIKPISISKAAREPHLDFEFLRARGLELLQQLTGQKWTDFNDHDPGITILEQLCYALTDLGYRSDYHIKDILTKGYSQPTIREENALYTLLDILTSKPITINDYRKIIIDQIPEVENAWIESVSMIPGRKSLNGFYNVWLQTGKKIEAEIQKNPLLKDRIVDKVRTLLVKERNLCEQFREINILQPQEIYIFARVLVNNKFNPEEVLARVYYNIERYLYGRVQFFTLTELQSRGLPLNDIISGPRLQNGFLTDDDLRPRILEISISTINRIIMAVEGVENVKGLSITNDPTTTGKEYFALDPGSYPVLNTSFLEGIDNYSLQIYKENFEYPVNRQRMENYLRELWAVSHRAYSIAERSGAELAAHSGEYREIENYNSIQNDFPKLYMIDRRGIPDSAPEIRKAQANQLKGYLLFFEQILANYFRQVQSVGDIFSINLKGEDKTYFAQPLYNVPHVFKLLKDFELKTSREENKTEFQDRWKEFQESGNEYSKLIQDTSEHPLEFMVRKNRIFDHLLARFGEFVDEYSLSSFQSYYGDITQSSLSRSLQIKSVLLKQYREIGYNRARAADYTDGYWGRTYSSGLEHKVALLLGFHTHEKRKFSTLPLQQYLHIAKTKNDDTKPAESDKVNWTGEDVEIVYDDDLGELDIEDTDLGTRKVFAFRGPKREVLRDTLLHGIELKNYRIGPLERNGEKEQVLIFKNPEEKTWKVISKHSRRPEAVMALQKLIDGLTRISMESEGFHLLEHVLLQHDPSEKAFGFFFIDRRGIPFLKNYHPLDFYARYDLAKEILHYGRDRANYYMDRVDNKNFRLVIHNGEDEPIATSSKNFTLVDYGGEDVEREIKRTIRNINIMHEQADRFIAQVQLFTQVHDKLMVHDDFFSFNATVILPDWPARFQDPGFKIHLQNIFKMHSPAHIRLNFRWLDFFAMKDFEVLYEKWTTAYQQKNEELGSLSAELVSRLRT
jgi:hypothetical protein